MISKEDTKDFCGKSDWPKRVCRSEPLEITLAEITVARSTSVEEARWRRRCGKKAARVWAAGAKCARGPAARAAARLRCGQPNGESVAIPATSDRTLHPRNRPRTLSTTR